MKGIPEIRFNKYSEDWIQDHFSDLTYPAGVKNRDNLDLPSYSITNDHGFVRQDVKFENGGTMKDADKSMYYIVSPHSFAYNPARINVGSIGYQDLDHNVIISSLYEIFKVSGPVVDKFLWWWFKTQAFKTQVKKLQEGGVRLYFFYDKLCKSILQYPKSKQEQTAIGKFFDDLDEYISSQALELQKLKNIKKACLEKMFPKEGELVPEIRFNGFEGNWVIKTLGELFTKVTEKNIDNSLTETFTNSAQEGIISQRDYFNHDISNIENINGYYVVRPDDFVYNPRMSVTAPVGPINRNKLLRSGVMSPLYSVFRAKDERTDLTFLEYFFKTDKWYNFMWKNGDNGARGDRFSIRDEVFQLLPIIIPPSKKEQISIANYFSSLDKFICSTSNKLDKLKQIRKGLLEKMFVANN